MDGQLSKNWLIGSLSKVRHTEAVNRAEEGARINGHRLMSHWPFIVYHLAVGPFDDMI